MPKCPKVRKVLKRYDWALLTCIDRKKWHDKVRKNLP